MAQTASPGAGAPGAGAPGSTVLPPAAGAGTSAKRDPGSATASGIGEIIVTAQRREQRLQSVPIAISAVTQESLATNRIVNVVDLSGLAPGLVARPNAGALGNPAISLRGVFATGGVPGADRQVSTYLDGVYLGIARGSIFDLPDIERIEVLRGPQGTLFGRNSTAGAISVVTRNPTGDFRVRQEFTVGNYAQLRTRTTVDLPTFGPFSAYITYVHDEREGDVRNLGAGSAFDRSGPFTGLGVQRSPKRLGDRNFENVFAALRFVPTDGFSMTYKFDRSAGAFTPDARAPTVVNPNSLVGSLLTQIIAAQPAGGGAFGPVVLNPSSTRPDATNNAWTVAGFQRAFGHSVTSELKLSDAISLKNISAYRKSIIFGPQVISGLSGLQFTAGSVQPYARFAAISSVAGFSGFPAATQQAIVNSIATALTPAVGQYFAGYDGNNYGNGQQYSSETQLNYESKLLTLTVGGLWFHSKELSSGLPGFRPNFAFAPVAAMIPLGSVLESRIKSTSIAAYAQGEVHVTPQIDIVAGARITRDKKIGSLTTGGTFVPDVTGTRTSGSIVGTRVLPFLYKKTKPNFSIGANYKPSNDLLLYGKYSTAFMSGGSIGGVDFAPETVSSIEAGAKADLLDRHLRVNLAVYHATYRHSQSAQSGSNAGHPELSTLIVDNGTLKVDGVEAEVTVAPVRGLTMGGSLGYTDARLIDPNPIVVAGSFGEYKNTGVSKWTSTLNAQYQTAPLFDKTYASFRIDANFRGKYRSIPNPNIENIIPVFAPYEFVRSAWVLNSRLSLREIKVGPARGEVALWSRNLTNNKAPAFPTGFADILIGTSFQAARTYGIDFIVNF